MYSFIKLHRKLITAIIVIVTIGLFSVPLFGELPLYSKTATALELVLIVSQVLSCLFVIIGTVIAVWQYYLSSKSEMLNLEINRVQKAIDLSRYYKDEILMPFSAIKAIYINAGIVDVLAKEKNRMDNFDYEEMREIFSASEIAKLDALIQSKEFIDSMIRTNSVLDLRLEGCKTVEELDENGDSKTTLRVDTDKFLISFTSRYITHVMNNLEHFAMYFTHNVADESVVYQSLAPSYLEICRVLYYNISKCSKPGETKLYRNLQQLYKIWAEREKMNKQKLKEHDNTPGTIPQNF